MLGVAMFSLLVLRSVVNGTPGDADGALPRRPARPDTARRRAAVDIRRKRAKNRQDDRPRLRLKKGKSLKDDLVEIVREDPDAAADILRSWIGKAG